MNQELENFNSYLSSLSNIDPSSFKLAIPFLETKDLKKGDYFVREGSYCQLIAFIDKGLFRIYSLKKGEELNTCFCLENNIMSSFESLVRDIPSSENIVALEDSRIVTMSYENINKLSENNSSWNKLKTVLTEKECLRLAHRVNEMSFESALEKYRNLMVNEPEVLKRVSNFHIASYLGISRETLSRIRAKIAHS